MVTSRDKNDDVIIIVTSQKKSYIRSYLTQENMSTKFQGRIINFSRVLVGGFKAPPHHVTYLIPLTTGRVKIP